MPFFSYLFWFFLNSNFFYLHIPLHPPISYPYTVFSFSSFKGKQGQLGQVFREFEESPCGEGIELLTAAASDLVKGLLFRHGGAVGT